MTIDCLVIGDCCQPRILEQAKVQQCRAILLVSSHERVNIQAAFATRAASPNVGDPSGLQSKELIALLTIASRGQKSSEATLDGYPSSNSYSEALNIADIWFRVISVSGNADRRIIPQKGTTTLPRIDFDLTVTSLPKVDNQDTSGL